MLVQVKAGEPVMSGMVNAVFYNKPPSKPKWVCIIFIVAGVAFSSARARNTWVVHRGVTDPEVKGSDVATWQMLLSAEYR